MADTSNASPCEISDDKYNSSRQVIKVLGKTVRHNYFLLFLAFAFTVAAILVVIYIVFKIIEVLRIYYKYHVRKNRAQFNTNSDNYTYKSSSSSGNASNNIDEHAAIESKIAAIKNRYHSYNKEIGSYTRNVLGRNPDDLINEQILAREFDDYNYQET